MRDVIFRMKESRDQHSAVIFGVLKEGAASALTVSACILHMGTGVCSDFPSHPFATQAPGCFITFSVDF